MYVSGFLSSFIMKPVSKLIGKCVSKPGQVSESSTSGSEGLTALLSVVLQNKCFYENKMSYLFFSVTLTLLHHRNGEGGACAVFTVTILHYSVTGCDCFCICIIKKAEVGHCHVSSVL